MDPRRRPAEMAVPSTRVAGSPGRAVVTRRRRGARPFMRFL